MATQQTIVKPDFPEALLRMEDGGALQPPILFGRFELRQLVRRSHMSLLCRGTRGDTGEAMAVKICLKTADRARFEREIKHTHSIRFAAVIKIQPGDVGVTKDGCPFYAMPWIEGPTLGAFLEDKRRSADEKLRAVEELARIVAVLHEKGVCHRDLKPSNVMVEGGRCESIKLLDLGLARSEADDLTLTGVHVGGTPGYYPPWSVERPGLIKTFERQWDVYSLAVILVGALTGVRPAGESDPNFTPEGVKELLRKHLPGDRRFDALLARCLAADPNQCPPSADDFYTAFRACRGLRHRPARTLPYAMAGVLGLALLAGAHEGLRRLAPERYEIARAWLLGAGTLPPPNEPIVAPPDPRILSYSNATVRLSVSPPGSGVHVINHRANGVVLTNLTVTASGEVDLLLPEDPAADYGLLVFKAGYHEYRQSLKPGSGPIEVRLERLRSELEFRSTPGALIELRHADGETRMAGPVPAGGQLLVQSLDEGDWTWRITRADYETTTGKVTGLAWGKKQVVDRPLQPLPGRLSVVGHPTMEVWRGNTRLQPTDGWIPLAAGAQDLELRRRGFRSQALRVEILPNRDLSRVAEPFVPEAGTLRVSLDLPAAAAEWFAQATKRLSLDGVPLNPGSFPHTEEDVGAGSHTVRLEVDGFTSEERLVEIRDGEVSEVRFALQLLPARLTVVSEPADAEVFRGESRLGRTGAELSIPPLERLELEVRAAGWRTARLLVPAVSPGGAHRQEVKLEDRDDLYRRALNDLRTRSLLQATRESPWTNSLGLKFVPVAGTGVLFCIWETRVQDFEAFVQATGHDATQGMSSLRKDGWKHHGDTWKSPGFRQGPTHPVVGVSYDDAAAFCAWLTAKEQREGRLPAGWTYRLPTDSEWSAAAGNTSYPWGDAWPPPKDAGNYAGEEAKDENWPDNCIVPPNWRDRFPRTAPVGNFAPNPFGLYDLGGNVMEWCSDWYGKAMNTDEVRRLMPELDQDHLNTARVLRGASWLNGSHAAFLASGSRGIGGPEDRIDILGFRVVVGGGSR
ncbi:MAG: SUMF1/EgtB/PvdO family nonheme iron enzyme [Verrucomicrobiales bacterium]|nr:SUMF1/EgtB/PvdO family nonheme iron enzyme [Verrucomicrobiales bacterium]